MTTWNPTRGGALSSGQLDALASDFLRDGFRRDEIVIDELDVDGLNAHARCSMRGTYLPPNDPVWHLQP